MTNAKQDAKNAEDVQYTPRGGITAAQPGDTVATYGIDFRPGQNQVEPGPTNTNANEASRDLETGITEPTGYEGDPADRPDVTGFHEVTEEEAVTTPVGSVLNDGPDTKDGVDDDGQPIVKDRNPLITQAPHTDDRKS